MKQKILTIMFASVMAMLAFTACNNDDEPQEPSGEKMVENIDKIIADQAEAGNLYLKIKDGYDPEHGEGGNNTFPFSRLITFGVDLTF